MFRWLEPRPPSPTIATFTRSFAPQTRAAAAAVAAPRKKRRRELERMMVRSPITAAILATTPRCGDESSPRDRLVLSTGTGGLRFAVLAKHRPTGEVARGNLPQSIVRGDSLPLRGLRVFPQSSSDLVCAH